VTETVVARRSQENVIPDGADRFEADVEQSATAIQEFIQALDESAKDGLLVRLLSMGRGSLDFAKQLVAENLPYLRNLHPRVTYHGVNVVSVFQWKLNKKMPAVRSDNASLLIEPSTIFASTEIFLRCASKHDVTFGQMNIIFQWGVSTKQLIASLLYGSMASWVGETGVSYPPVQLG